MDVKIELLQACMKDNRKAQFELYQCCYSVMMSVCYRYEQNKEDAEFLLNKAFYKILTNLKNYNTAVPFEAWIRRITINTAIDEYRKNKRARLDYVEEPADWAPLKMMDYNEAESKFDADDLLAMVRNLPAATQKVFNLYVIDGYNHKEIAEQMQMSEGTSKWHLSNARKKLQDMIKKMMNNVAMLL